MSADVTITYSRDLCLLLRTLREEGVLVRVRGLASMRWGGRIQKLHDMHFKFPCQSVHACSRGMQKAHGMSVST